MKFKLGKRLAEFGKFNNRLESHGAEKVKAIDLPVSVAINTRDLDMLVPCQGVKFSDAIYEKRGKKHYLRTFVLSPLPVHRKPENLDVTIWDQELDEKKKIDFAGAKLKDPKVTFEDEGVMRLEFTLQLSKVSTDTLSRIVDNVEAKTRHIQIDAKQSELFDTENDKDEDEDEDGDEE